MSVIQLFHFATVYIVGHNNIVEWKDIMLRKTLQRWNCRVVSDSWALYWLMVCVYRMKREAQPRVPLICPQRRGPRRWCRHGRVPWNEGRWKHRSGAVASCRQQGSAESGGYETSSNARDAEIGWGRAFWKKICLKLLFENTLPAIQ